MCIRISDKPLFPTNDLDKFKLEAAVVFDTLMIAMNRTESWEDVKNVSSAIIHVNDNFIKPMEKRFKAPYGMTSKDLTKYINDVCKEPK